MVTTRRLCAKLYLKAETQQVDRILEEFSRRYWDCNPGGLYGSASKSCCRVVLLPLTCAIGVVHAVSYSLLLLNTDLHVAELNTRMSRSQFVRNTLTAVQMQLQPTKPTASPASDNTYDDCASDSTETIARSKRSDSITSWSSVSRDAIASPVAAPHLSPTNQTNQTGDTSNGITQSIPVPSVQEQNASSPVGPPVYGRNWETDMESLLKVSVMSLVGTLF